MNWEGTHRVLECHSVRATQSFYFLLPGDGSHALISDKKKKKRKEKRRTLTATPSHAQYKEKDLFLISVHSLLQ